MSKDPNLKGIADHTPIKRTEVFRTPDGRLVNSRNCPIKDIAGMRFARLVALEFYASVGHERRAFWKFKCDCGVEKVLNRIQVECGKTKSCGCLQKEKEADSAFHTILSGYKAGAKVRNLQFLLTEEEFRTLILGNCYYCGTPPKNNRRFRVGGKVMKYNGVDRVDSKQGYHTDNVVSCCAICNRAKSNLTLPTFLAWIGRIKAYESEIHRTCKKDVIQEQAQPT